MSKVKPFKVYFLTRCLLNDFNENGGLCSWDAEEDLFLWVEELENEKMDVDNFLENIEFLFGLKKKNLKTAYLRFLDYVKNKP